MADLAHATENDNDLIGDANSAHWAERFASKFTVLRISDAKYFEGEDLVGLMITWFAGAIETGVDHAR
jgi:hypothetical protein